MIVPSFVSLELGSFHKFIQFAIPLVYSCQSSVSIRFASSSKVHRVPQGTEVSKSGLVHTI